MSLRFAVVGLVVLLATGFVAIRSCRNTYDETVGHQLNLDERARAIDAAVKALPTFAGTERKERKLAVLAEIGAFERENTSDVGRKKYGTAPGIWRATIDLQDAAPTKPGK